MSIAGYARVSTNDHASGATTDRPDWQACLRSLGVGDTLVVARIDRLGRSLVDLVTILDELHARGVHFRSLSEAIDTSTPTGRLVFHVAGAFAEYERALIRERTREGLAAARARGARVGRPRALTPEQIRSARELSAAGWGTAAIARSLGVSRSTIQRSLRRSVQL